jgi:hypothetical protein
MANTLRALPSTTEVAVHPAAGRIGAEISGVDIA